MTSLPLLAGVLMVLSMLLKGTINVVNRDVCARGQGFGSMMLLRFARLARVVVIVSLSA
jgi:hypothetical protein